MSFPRRRKGALVPTLVVVGALLIGFVYLSQVYADVLWYNQLGYLEVFLKENAARLAVFLSAFLVMAGAVYLSLRLSYRARPVYAPDSAVQDNLNRYQAQLEPVRRLLMVAIPMVLGGFAGTAAASQWQQVLLFFNQVPFGEADPQFNMDYSFYLNTLPFLGFLTGFLMSVVIIAGIAGLLTHYLYGGIRLEEKGIFTSTPARIHVAVFAVLFLLLQAVNYWLDRYSTLQGSGGQWTGALYTDVNAVIPTKAILAVAAVIVAALFVVAAVGGRWRLAVVGTAMLVITALVAGGLYPWIIQQYQVRPSERSLERPYIERNINLTRKAYGLENVEVTPYNAKVDATEGALRQDAETTANIRLLDPNLVSAAFGQLQQFRPYYQFAPTLSVDRYNVNGTVQDTVIAVRELQPNRSDSWFNQHVVYTHGYGVVAAYGSKIAADGRPEFMMRGIPTTGVLGDDSTYEPRIYFGEYSPSYSIVGAPEGASPQELDRPQDQSSTSEAKTTFRGSGGPSVGNFFNRLVYSLKFQSTDLMLSNAVNSESQILYDRNPRERVEKLAPYLTVDGNAYPAIIDGRVKWIVDGYTTSDHFPYSTPQQLDSATRDSLTTGTRAAALVASKVNYIRNAVKATVDAYDGSVTLYAWDDKDPLLKAWQKVFPTTLKPFSEMSPDLMSHVRYPEDLFKVQRELLGRYHVTNPDNFYENNDAWSVPNDPTVPDREVKQPPFYLSLKMPGQDNPAFSLTSSFIPQSSPNAQQRNVLYGFLAAEADAGSEAGKKSPDYGKLRLLELPRSTAVPGPGQAQNTFDSDTTVSQALNLLRQGASDVINGNLLTLPVGGGVLHVQPVYVRSTGETSYPTLRRVLVAFGENVGFAPTLDEALDQLFGGDSGAGDSGGDAGAGGDGKTDDGAAGGTDGGSSAAASAQAALRSALNAANAAIREGRAALAAGDFAAYGVAQEKLNAALVRALAAEKRLGQASTGSPTSSPTSSPTPTEQASTTPAP